MFDSLLCQVRNVVAELRARTRPVFADLELFCAFVGYPRSGHSLVGSLLTAHPEAVIAHEYNALKHLSDGATRHQLLLGILDKDRAFLAAGRNQNGYNYRVPGQWQGRWRRLRVIGDKKGAATSSKLRREPDLLDSLRETVGLPLRLIHVARNPFDMMTTRALARGLSLEHAIASYLRHLPVVASSVERYRSCFLELRFEDFVAAPEAHLRQLAEHLTLPADPAWLESCRARIFPRAKKTRLKVRWTPAQIERVLAAIAPWPMFRDYTFAD